MKVGLSPLADRVALAVRHAARAKKGAADTQRRIVAQVLPALEEAVLIGVDQALIAARNFPDAQLLILARKRELEQT